MEGINITKMANMDAVYHEMDSRLTEMSSQSGLDITDIEGVVARLSQNIKDAKNRLYASAVLELAKPLTETKTGTKEELLEAFKAQSAQTAQSKTQASPAKEGS